MELLRSINIHSDLISGLGNTVINLPFKKGIFFTKKLEEVFYDIHESSYSFLPKIIENSPAVSLKNYQVPDMITSQDILIEAEEKNIWLELDIRHIFEIGNCIRDKKTQLSNLLCDGLQLLIFFRGIKGLLLSGRIIQQGKKLSFNFSQLSQDFIWRNKFYKISPLLKPNPVF